MLSSPLDSSKHLQSCGTVQTSTAEQSKYLQTCSPTAADLLHRRQLGAPASRAVQIYTQNNIITPACIAMPAPLSHNTLTVQKAGMHSWGMQGCLRKPNPHACTHNA